MTTVLNLPETRTIRRNVTWEMYENLLAERPDKSVPRYTYDQGLLEIMSPSFEHEEIKESILLLVRVWGAAIKISLRSFGSTTFRRKDLARGFEPDTCFYIQSVKQLNTESGLDLAKNPPPDVVVEIDITNSSINKLPLFAQIGVPEVWIYTKRMRIFKLESGTYTEVEESPALRGLTASTLTDLIKQSKSLEDSEWLQLVMDEARRSV